MCNLSHHIILSEIPDGQISWCRGCKSYSLIYKSACLSFSSEKLIGFKEVLLKLSEEDFIYNFCGQQQVLLKNQFAYIGICLSQHDVKLMEQMIEEALALNEVFALIYS